MMRYILALLSFLVWFGPAFGADQVVVNRSPHSVKLTVDRLVRVLDERGITVFARINHAGGAKLAGQTLRPTELLLFGNPKLGTPLMQSNRKIGIDLPLKALVWEDEAGKVWIAYPSTEALKARHNITDKNALFDRMAKVLKGLIAEATKPQ